jgi:hypothetical protein
LGNRAAFKGNIREAVEPSLSINSRIRNGWHGDHNVSHFSGATVVGVLFDMLQVLY